MFDELWPRALSVKVHYMKHPFKVTAGLSVSCLNPIDLFVSTFHLWSL